MPVAAAGILVMVMVVFLGEFVRSWEFVSVALCTLRLVVFCEVGFCNLAILINIW